MHNGSDGITTPQAALRATNNLNPFDIARGQVFPAKLIARCRIVRSNSIDKNQDVVGLATAHPNLRLRADTSRLADRESGHCSQQVCDIPNLPAFNVLSSDNSRRAANLADSQRGSRAGNDDLVHR